MKFVLFVEGHTEKSLSHFLKRWLDPRLPKPVGIQVVRFDGWGNYAKEIAKKVELHLSGRSGEQIIGAVGLLDLYGPDFYPAQEREANARYRWAKQHFEGLVAHPKFRQHFAVHEVEAWLLADHGLSPNEVLRALPPRCGQPEQINFSEPPKRLLNRLFHEKLHRNYKEVTDGTNLFQRLKPETVYEKCPYFKLLLDDMLKLASA